MCFFVEKNVCGRSGGASVNRHSLSPPKKELMTTLFVYILAISRLFWRTQQKKSPHRRNKKKAVLENIQAAAKREVPDENFLFFFPFWLNNGVFFFGFIGNRRAKTRFCLSYQEEVENFWRI